MTTSERVARYRARRQALWADHLKRIHDTICAAARRGEPDALLLAGGSVAETMQNLADEQEQRFGASVPATTN